MRYCLLMHYQEGPEVGLTEEDMAPAMAAFQQYADDLSAAGVLIDTEVLESVVATTTVTAHTGTHRDPGRAVRRHQGEAWRHLRHRGRQPRRGAEVGATKPANAWGWIEIRPVARTYAADRGWYNP
jgi:hypothetical protein